MQIYRIMAGVLATVLFGMGAARGQIAERTIERSRPEPMRFTTASITLKVPKFAEARQQVLEAARRDGAELLDARTRVTENGRQHGWVRLRLDADRLPAFLNTLRQTGTLYAEKVGTTDNQSEYESLDRRAERLKEHQARLSTLLDNQRRLRGSDILYVQERLFRASVDEGLLQQRRADMARRGQVAHVEVALFEPLPIRRLDRAQIDLAAHFGEAKGYAGSVLSGFARRAATVAAYAVVFAPFWLPVALLILLLTRWLARRGVLLALWHALLAVGAAGIAVIAAARDKIARMGIGEMVSARGGASSRESESAMPEDGSPVSAK